MTRHAETRRTLHTHTHTHTHTCSLLPSIKQIGTICFLFLISIFPTFADNEPTLIPTPASCNNSVLNTTEGSASLEAIYTPNTIGTTWYSDGEQLEVDNAATSCTYDTAMTLPTNPTKPGYAFNGWKLKTPCLIRENMGSYVSAGAQGQTWWFSASTGYRVDGIASCSSTLPTDLAYLANHYALNMSESEITEYASIAGQEKAAIVRQAVALQEDEEYVAAQELIAQLFLLPSNANYSTSDTGRYCLCKATNYTSSGNEQCSFDSSVWFLYGNLGDSAYCARDCSSHCADSLYLFNQTCTFKISGVYAQ